MKNTPTDHWPDDADGDVLRRMVEDGFNFNEEVDIDFNIDFEKWPPCEEVLEVLHAQFPRMEIYSPDAHGSGYVQIVITAVVTYDLVMFMQASVSEMVAKFGGVCDSWGMMQSPPIHAIQ